MKFAVPSLRSVARLMTLLFVMQVVVAGACMLTPQAHAMPMAQPIDAAHAPCSDPAVNQGDLDGHDHGDACFHCDEPDVSLTATTSLLQAPAVFTTLVAVPSATLHPQPLLRQLRFVRTPTGPPRSASLLYTTSQRIRI
ncbi:MAG: hypothetical protein R8J84_06330 [Mariprofundales bacterium]